MYNSLPITEKTKKSSDRVILGLENGKYLQHDLSNSAIPFSDKQADYLYSYLKTTDNLNFRYILESEGVSDDIYYE